MGILFTRIWRLFNHQGERRAGPGPLARAVGAGQGRAGPAGCSAQGGFTERWDAHRRCRPRVRRLWARRERTRRRGACRACPAAFRCWHG